MAAMTGLLGAVGEPSGLWAIIIRAFESGVGSYILAVLLLTLLIRLVWAPVDTLNKKFNKKMTRSQLALQPQFQKLEKQYAKDPRKLQEKKQELMKKANAGLGGGCLFMFVFMILNLFIFGSMFTTMNSFASYKVYEQYEKTKYAYGNVLNLFDQEKNADLSRFGQLVDNYQDLEIKIEDGKIFLAKTGENEPAFGSQKYDFVTDFGVIEDGRKTQTAASKISNLVSYYIADDGDESTGFIGENKFSTDTTVSQAVQNMAIRYVDSVYAQIQQENSFLWVGNIWVADSPTKQSVFSYSGYEGVVGKNNVDKLETLDENGKIVKVDTDASEKVVYESFMNEISAKYNKTNGYFILAIISIGITYLSILVSSGKIKNQIPGQRNKLMMILLPLIMGLFAIFYNSVFAFYLVVSQALGALLAPLQNMIVDKWESHDAKKEEAKTVVEYSRHKL